MVDKAIIQLCREEYNVEVNVEIIGDTVGVYLPIEGLFDMTLNISKEAANNINDVILSVSRVTLSSDADLAFYIVIAQDPLLPEIEVVLIRYLRDLRMLHYEQISRGEFAKRMIVSIKVTPQAQKAQVLKDVLGRLEIDDAEAIIAEYLDASTVTSIEEIGYWNDIFYMKDIDMGEFLALQIAERAKGRFLTSPELMRAAKIKAIDGEYLNESGKQFFRFSYELIPAGPERLFADEGASDGMAGLMLDEAAKVAHGYRFNDFWNVEIRDSASGETLFATAEELEEYRKKKLKKEELRRWRR
jgi:hypothetical protein